MNTANSAEMSVHSTTQKLCAWGGPILVVTMFVGWGLIAGFIPLPSPTNSPEEVVRFFSENPLRLRIGILICMFGSAFLGLWVAALTVQIKRIEGYVSPLAYAQLALGAAAVVEFLTPLAIWGAVAFRPEEGPLITYRLNDVAWILWLAVGQSITLQAVVFGYAILQDKRKDPIFPRWLAYFNFWCATLFLPCGLCMFFKAGPFAWDGVIAWWVVAIAYAIWLSVIAMQISFKAVPSHEAELGSTPGFYPVSTDGLERAENF